MEKNESILDRVFIAILEGLSTVTEVEEHLLSETSLLNLVLEDADILNINYFGSILDVFQNRG